MTDFVIHFPLLNLIRFSTALTNQSIVIAIHTPKTPTPMYLPITYANPILKIHIDAVELNNVNFASPDARNALANVNANGHINTQQILCYLIICIA